MTVSPGAAFHPLANVRVLDWTEGVAGPCACQMLGDLGADVIKIERPQGDWGRGFGGGTGTVKGNAEFKALNRNKRDICLDLSRSEALEVAGRLIDGADVMVTSYRPGVMERLGLGYEAVRARAPRLIYARISAFGYSGPMANRPGSDTIMQAVTGLMSQIGEPDGLPQRVGIPIVDLFTARDTVIGVLAALLARGLGEEVPGPIDVSLFASAAAAQGSIWQKFFERGVVQKRSGHRHPGLAPAGLYRTRDSRYIAVATLRQEHWQNFCRAVGRDDLLGDPRFASNAIRLQHRDELEAELVPVFSERSFDEWTRVLLENDVMAAPVTELSDIAADPELSGSLWLTDMPEGELGPSAQAIGLPVSFGGAEGSATKSPPARGQHTREILTQLGYSDDAIERLVASGVTPDAELPDRCHVGVV